MKKRIFTFIRQREALLTTVLLSAAGILYYLPRFLMDGIPHYFNEDTFMHLNRLVGMRNVWTSPVSFLNFAHNGPAVNIFYPWLPMYPMYLLYRLSGSYVTGYKLFYLLLTLATLFLCYRVMKKISGSRMSAVLFAVMYSYSAYRFINLFRRAHLGESIAMTALPLVIFGLYSIAFGDRRYWWSLALGMAGIAYSHNIFLLITSLTTGLYVILSLWFWDQKGQRLLSLCKSAASAILFSLGTFVPTLQYLTQNSLYTPGGSGQGLQDSAFGLGEIIRSSLRNEPVSYAVGLLVLAALAFLVIFYVSHLIRKDKTERNPGIDFMALTGGLIFLAASSLLPWKTLGDRTALYYLQFVWRLNSQSTILILAAFAFYFPKVLRSRGLRYCCTLLIIAAAAGLHFSAILTLHREENTRILEADIAAGDAITFDYAPSEAKSYRSIHGYTLDDLYINGEPYPAEVSYSEDGTEYRIVINAPSAAADALRADIPVFRYSSQRCTLNGEVIQTTLSERGTTLAALHPGEENVLTISYAHTPLTYAAWIISLAAFVLITFFHMRKFQKA